MLEVSAHFMGDEEDNPQLDKYKHFYLGDVVPTGATKLVQGVFSASLSSGGMCSLFVNGEIGHRVSLRYDRNGVLEKDGGEWFSIGDAGRFDEIVDAADETFVPLGSYIDPGLAWRVTSAFFQNPFDLPDCVEWFDSRYINWPE